MKSVKELIAKRQSEIDGAKALRDKAAASGRDLTDSELAVLDGHLDRAGQLKTQIEAAQETDHDRVESLRRLAAEDAWGSQVQEGQRVRPTNPAHAAGPGSPGWGEAAMPTRSTGRRYETIFGRSVGSSGGFRTMGDFLSAVGNAPTHHDDRLQLASAVFAGMTEGIDSEGGFAVPIQFAREIVSGFLEDSIMLSRCDVRPMSGAELRVPAFDDSDHSSGLLYGGVSATWAEEGGQPDASTPKLRQLRLHANKLFILVQVSSELLADAPAMESELGRVLSKAGSFFVDDAMIATGTGAGQPLAVLSCPGVVTASKDTSQIASTVTYTNLAAMVGKLHPSCFQNSVWLVNPTVVPQLLSLVVKVQNVAGTENVGGSFVPVLSESSGQLRLLTRPCIVSEKCKRLGAAGDIILLDPTQYTAGVRQNIEITRSNHVGFLTDSVYFRMIVRIDGQSRWNSTVTMKNGGEVGWAVTLETRS